MTKILITGAAGFIGSHLLSQALKSGMDVVGVDNFLTGKKSNIEAVLNENKSFSDHFELICGDIRDLPMMKRAVQGCAYILHEAAIGSVPWSIDDPLLAHSTNLTGFINILEAARSAGIRRVVYASSSAVFGDATGCPAREGEEGECLSPYASSKRAQEIYAQAYARCYDMTIVGLRYFNVFGARQDPQGAYAAVIPKWGACMRHGQPCKIYGDGRATRDFCHVSNIVRANFLAAESSKIAAMPSAALNVGCGRETDLLTLHADMACFFNKKYGLTPPEPEFCAPRSGDIQRSCADISRTEELLGYQPMYSVKEGIEELICSGEFDSV